MNYQQKSNYDMFIRRSWAYNQEMVSDKSMFGYRLFCMALCDCKPDQIIYNKFERLCKDTRAAIRRQQKLHPSKRKKLGLLYRSVSSARFLEAIDGNSDQCFDFNQ